MYHIIIVFRVIYFLYLVVYQSFSNIIMLQQLTYNTHYLLKPKIIPTNAMALSYNQPYYYNYY